MAAISEDAVETYLKTTIQILYEIQSATHGYLGPETQAVLVDKVTQLADSLAALSSATTTPGALPSSELLNGNSKGNGDIVDTKEAGRNPNADENANTIVPPDILAYIEEGRNPDIYTREFVELVQRANGYLKGKSEAWASFANVLAEEMEKARVGDGELGEGRGVADVGMSRLEEGAAEVKIEKIEESGLIG